MQVLLAGVPATGKSSFAGWISEKYDLDNIDIDREPHRYGPDAWRVMPRVVIDWGFPVHCLPVVKQLVASGFDHWWFDGDRDAARQSFLSRSGHPANLAALDTQMGNIERHWKEIAELFSGRVVNVINAGPRYLSNEERLAEMVTRGLRLPTD
jgi:hypothetical protein